MREYKLLVLGSDGKNKLITQFVYGTFANDYDRTIDDSYRNIVEVDGQLCMLEIIDTAGMEQFTAMRDVYIKKSDGFMLIYLIADQSTFNDLQDIRQGILRVKDTDDVPMILVGIKRKRKDRKVIGTDQVAKLAQSFNDCAFIELTSRDHDHVNEVFYELVRQVDKKLPNIIQDVSKKQSRCVLF